MPFVEFQGDRAKLGQWLFDEYHDACEARRSYERMLDEWDRQYEAIPREAVKTFPWVNASNLEVPVGATHTDTVVSRIEDNYFSTKPFVILTPLGSSKWEKHIKALENYMNQVSLPQSHYRDEKSIDILTSCKLGTGFSRLTYEQKYKYVKIPSRRGYRDQRIVVHDGPLQAAIHPKNLIFPSEARNIETSRWISVRDWSTWGNIESLKNQRGYDKDLIESLRPHGTLNISDINREIRQGFRQVGRLRQWELVHTYCRYAEDQTGNEYDVWVHWHPQTKSVLRAIYNPYIHYEWPLSRSLYMQREDAMVGLGIMGMVSMIQQEIVNIHNYGLDNMIIANTIVSITKKSTVEDLEIFPMANISHTGDKDAVRFERIGQVLSSQQMGEMAANAYAERRTGSADSSINRTAPASGLASSRTPATTTMALLGEGNKRFALAIEQNKRADSRMLLQHVLLLKQYWPLQRRTAEIWDAEQASLIEEMFATLPVEAFRFNMMVEVSASTAAMNKEAEKANMLQIAEFMRNYYDLFISYVTAMAQFPAMQPIFEKILNGTRVFVERLLLTFDIRDPERFIPRLDDLQGTSQTPPELLQQLNQNFLNSALNGAANGARQ